MVGSGQGLADGEIMRVLVPSGVAYVKQADGWKKSGKPRPDEMDDWTHYLHDPTGNAVSHDALIEPPARY